MSRLVRKLRSETGATLMLALLLFIMCTVAGTVILAAGTATAGRAANGASGSLSQADQDMYTMASAVKVLRRQIEGGMVFAMGTYELKTPEDAAKTEFKDEDFAPNWKYLSVQQEGKKYYIGSVEYTESELWKQTFSATADGELQKFVTGEKTDSSTGKCEDTYYLRLQNPENPSGVTVYPVECAFSMDPGSYTITVKMRLCSISGTGAVEYVGSEAETIVFPAKIREYDDEVRKKGKKDFSNTTLTVDTRIRRKIISWGEGSPE